MADTNDKSTFEVRSEAAEKALKDVADLIKPMIPANMGFTLLIFDYGPDGSMFYMSSAERETMIKAMEEFIQKQKAS